MSIGLNPKWRASFADVIRREARASVVPLMRLGPPKTRDDEIQGALDRLRVFHRYEFVPRTVNIDNLIGLGRPGYRAYNEKGSEDLEPSEMRIDEEKQIDATLHYLAKIGVKRIISLSNEVFHESRDRLIQTIWERKMGAIETEGRTFFYIPNEDAIRNPFFREGDGPTVTKIKEFMDIVTSISRVEKIAVYCGAGRGRTCCYLSGYASLTKGLDPELAIKRVVDSSDWYGYDVIEDELSANGGMEVLYSLTKS